jgi:glycoside/pentoside/hexuronide:cation symporter, GPH family
VSEAPPSAASVVATPQSARETRPEDRVSFWEKTALGAGHLPLFLGYAAVNSFAVPVYQMTLQLDPALLALALAIPRFWDAMTDPAMGVISDNTQTRWGRRRPYIIIGAILQGLAFGLIWMVPGSWGQGATAAWLVVTLILFYSCFTVYSVPLYSLTYEMTPDYRERTRVAAFSGFFDKSGEFIYQWIFPLTQLAIFSSVIMGVRTVGWGVGLLLLAGVGMLPGFFVKERYFRQAARQAKVKFFTALRQSLGNRAFMILLGLTVLQILAGMIASNLDFYLLVYYLSDGDVGQGSIWKGILSTAYAIVGIAMIYPVNWLANRYGKAKTLSFTFVLVLFGSVVKWFVFTPGQPWLILLDPIFCGPVWVAINVLSLSMLADICDQDELRHGLRREGTFGAMFTWVRKFGYSTAFFGAMLSLKWVGFDAALGGNQSESTILGMRLVLAVPTALWAVAALALLAMYPLTRDRVYAIRDELEARRGRLSS